MSPVRLRSPRARGAALVEAVAAIPVLLVVFASVVYVARAFGERVRASQRAKEAAWTVAMTGCTEEPELFDTAATAPPGVTATFARVAGMEAFDRPLASARRARTSSVTASGILGGGTIQLSGTASVVCNETLIEDDFSALVERAWRTLATF